MHVFWQAAIVQAAHLQLPATRWCITWQQDLVLCTMQLETAQLFVCFHTQHTRPHACMIASVQQCILITVALRRLPRRVRLSELASAFVDTLSCGACITASGVFDAAS